MRKIVIMGLSVSVLFADSQMLTSKDFADFYLSSHIKEQVKNEIKKDLNISIEGAKVYLAEAIKEESEKHRKLYYAQVEEFAKDLATLKEEINFLRELVVDANYQRNSNDDALVQIKENFQELLKRIEKLESATKETPKIPDAGQKM